MIEMLMMAVTGAGECPQIGIVWTASEHLTDSYFAARIDPMPAAPVVLNWSVTRGVITPGPNAAEIAVSVDLGELMKSDVGYELTLDVAGLPAGCPRRATLQHGEAHFEMPPDPPARRL